VCVCERECVDELPNPARLQAACLPACLPACLHPHPHHTPTHNCMPHAALTFMMVCLIALFFGLSQYAELGVHTQVRAVARLLPHLHVFICAWSAVPSLSLHYVAGAVSRCASNTHWQQACTHAHAGRGHAVLHVLHPRGLHGVRGIRPGASFPASIIPQQAMAHSWVVCL